MIKIYGIPNCDTMKKARKWLESNLLPRLDKIPGLVLVIGGIVAVRRELRKRR